METKSDSYVHEVIHTSFPEATPVLGPEIMPRGILQEAIDASAPIIQSTRQSLDELRRRLSEVRQDIIQRYSLGKRAEDYLEVLHSGTVTLFNDVSSQDIRSWSGQIVGSSEFVRQTEKHENRQRLQNAKWQQRLAVLMLRHRSEPNIEKIIDRYWETFSAMGKLIGAEERAKERGNGVGRLVGSIRAFEQFGWLPYVPGETEDVERGCDLVIGRYEASREKVLVLCAQVKPSQSDEFGLDLFGTRLEDAPSSADEDADKVYRRAREVERSNPAAQAGRAKAGAALVRVPLMFGPTFRLSADMFDRFKNSWLNDLARFSFELFSTKKIPAPPQTKKKGRQVYVPNKG